MDLSTVRAKLDHDSFLWKQFSSVSETMDKEHKYPYLCACVCKTK